MLLLVVDNPEGLEDLDLKRDLRDVRSLDDAEAESVSVLNTFRLDSHVYFGCPLRPKVSCVARLYLRSRRWKVSRVGTYLTRYPSILALLVSESWVKPMLCTFTIVSAGYQNSRWTCTVKLRGSPLDAIVFCILRHLDKSLASWPQNRKNMTRYLGWNRTVADSQVQ